MEPGRMLKVTMAAPRYHATEEGRWDFRVTIVYRNAATATKNFDDHPIELRVGASVQFRQGVAGLARLLVSAVAGDGGVGVGDGDDTRSERDFFARKGFGVTRTVKILVVMQDHLANPRQRCERVKNLGAKLHVGLHRFPYRAAPRPAGFPRLPRRTFPWPRR